MSSDGDQVLPMFGYVNILQEATPEVPEKSHNVRGSATDFRPMIATYKAANEADIID